MKIHIDENGDVIRCFGNVKPGDTHTLSTIRAVDEEIIGSSSGWLAANGDGDPTGHFRSYPVTGHNADMAIRQRMTHLRHWAALKKVHDLT